jgi:hypothetical protein
LTSKPDSEEASFDHVLVLTRGTEKRTVEWGTNYDYADGPISVLFEDVWGLLADQDRGRDDDEWEDDEWEEDSDA